MPIDINLLRKDRGGDPDAVRKSQKERYQPVEFVDEAIRLDEVWRSKLVEMEQIKKEMNALQRETKDLIKQKKDASALIEKRKALAKSEPQAKADEAAAKLALEKQVSRIANMLDPTVPVSDDEENNAIVAEWGLEQRRQPGDNVLHHHDILHRIGGYDPERGVAVAGHRAYFLTGVGVLLNQALINYSMSFLMKRKYTMLQPPYFMNKSVMAGVAQLEQFDEELYKVTGEDEKYLIATSEQPICGFHKGEWIPESSLPIRYGGYSTCFRKEAGAHGKDTWGIFRVHQFEKVEQFVLTEPEKSPEAHEEMLKCAQEFYESLGLAYRVVNIVSGELNNAAAKKLDLEAWFPAYGEFRELVSCSNCTDYQARAMEVRCGSKKLGQTDKKYVHMLNATLCATTRTICCILENYQTPDGVQVPEVLVPFCGGMTFLPFINEPKENLTKKKMEKAQQAKKKKESGAKTGSSKDSSMDSKLKAAKPSSADKGDSATNQLMAIEKALEGKGYISGFSPSSDDEKVYALIKNKVANLDQYPNVARWKKQMESFGDEERRQWTAPNSPEKDSFHMEALKKALLL